MRAHLLPVGFGLVDLTRPAPLSDAVWYIGGARPWGGFVVGGAFVLGTLDLDGTGGLLPLLISVRALAAGPALGAGSSS